MTDISLQEEIFQIKSEQEFNALCLRIFRYQYLNNTVYKLFTDSIGYEIDNISHYSQIPFLPIEFFKSYQITSGHHPIFDKIFTSSGTTGSNVSKHFVDDFQLYQKSFLKSFELFYGDPSQYILLALLPSYLEQDSSSLIYMTDYLIKSTRNYFSGFYLEHSPELIKALENKNKKIILLGVSYALLDFAEKYHLKNPETIVMETGGM